MIEKIKKEKGLLIGIGAWVLYFLFNFIKAPHMETLRSYNYEEIIGFLVLSLLIFEFIPNKLWHISSGSKLDDANQAASSIFSGSFVVAATKKLAAMLTGTILAFSIFLIIRSHSADLGFGAIIGVWPLIIWLLLLLVGFFRSIDLYFKTKNNRFLLFIILFGVASLVMFPYLFN